MIPFDICDLTDGVTTLDLLDKRNYVIPQEGYAPRVGTRRTSILSGRGPINDVGDSIPLVVLGDTAVQALDNLYALWGLLDQARRWNRNERVNPVRLRLRVNCGRRGILEAVVLGSIDDAMLDYTPEYKQYLGRQRWVIEGVSIAFDRRGQLLAPLINTDTVVNVGSGGYVITIDFNASRFSAQQTADPLKIQVSLPVASSLTINNIAILIADNTATTGGIERFDAAGLTSAAPFSNVLDTARFCASLDYVLRYTPTTTAAVQTQNTSSVFASQVRFSQRVAVYATVRNNSAVASYDLSVQAIIIPDSGIQLMAQTSPVTIPPYVGSAKPMAACLGVMAGYGDAATSTNAFEILRLTMQASAVDGSLDIDQVYVVALDTPGGADIFIPSQATLNLGSTTLLTIDPCQLTRQRPHVRLSSITGDSWRFLGGPGSTTWTVAGAPSIQCAILMPTGANWRYVNSGAAANLSVTLTRQLAFATPQ